MPSCKFSAPNASMSSSAMTPDGKHAEPPEIDAGWRTSETIMLKE